ncbi:hypothetical protein FJT64_003287 [Amphibalanus amphitrite]|uniref:RNase H type-1 domain-containing protein n=1 Tax=Amphibalanus amphitrite TaxID=1232801 RepID=A0A6A4WF88_AMPAM|nr:hypothetical protein FJT64_003287 [Amphibalanus amphitrite]
MAKDTHDSTEVCGVRILGKSPISIFNIYRPPIRRSPTDDREDNFDPAALPSDEDAIILELTTRFTEAIMSASRKYIPRGARKVVKPWALDPELQQAVAERREARRALRPGDPATRDRWVAAKRRAAETEKRVSQAHFRNFVETTLNKPASLGRVTKILKKWEGASDEHRPGQAMTEGDRLLVTDSEKAEAFNATYAHVSRQCATWVWTDGSATDGVLNGGAGALIVWPDGEERSVRAPAGRLCSSFRAEMVALQTALSFLLENPLHADDPVVICTDSQSALAALREGPAAQHSPLGGAIWRALRGSPICEMANDSVFGQFGQ